ncbi:MAG: DNA polymerase I, partial [Spirochaetaceae bacterium]|nr:DNA polymerase I [Spirochaetaceae bacterium]
MRGLAADLAALGGQITVPVQPENTQTNNVKVTYSSILSEEDMNEWGLRIRKSGILALDTETNNLDPMRADLVGLSVSIKSGEAAYLPVRCPDISCIPLDSVVKWLNELLSDGNIRIIGQNFKYDMKVLIRAGVNVGGAWFDTMIAAWVLDSSSPVGMDALADRYLGISTVKFKDVVPKGSTFDEVSLDAAVEYAAEDADITWRLYEILSDKLKLDEKRLSIFQDMEMPLQPILAGMEIEGIGLDIFELEAYGEELKGAVDSLVKEIHNLCGHEFNIASPKQLQKVLFEERGLTPGKKTKTGYSTDNSVLSDLSKEDPVPEKILLYRSLAKLKSTYVDVLPQLVHPKDGRIHTNYSQTGAATGRLSSNNPNLQNIPVRDDNGRRIRTAFKSRPDYVFVSADYSQIELVVLAHMSGDEALTAAFKEGVDVHARTAASLLGIDASDVTSEQRRMAKAVNFGVMYGMSAFRLSNEMGISRKEAKHFIDAYFTTYRGIKLFVEQAV